MCIRDRVETVSLDATKLATYCPQSPTSLSVNLLAGVSPPLRRNKRHPSTAEKFMGDLCKTWIAHGTYRHSEALLKTLTPDAAFVKSKVDGLSTRAPT